MPKPSVSPIEGPEVVADEALNQRRRRAFSAQFKRRILEQAEACEKQKGNGKHSIQSHSVAPFRLPRFAPDSPWRRRRPRPWTITGAYARL